MPIRNMWSLEPDECIVAEEVLLKIKPSEVYFPVHDKGIDLLVALGTRHAGIQVKGSRYYKANTRGAIPHQRWHSWHQVDARKLLRAGPDFYVFVTYLPIEGRNGGESFQTKFLVVPTGTLRENVRQKKGGKKGVYSFYFRFEEGEIVDIREKSFRTAENDYTEFLNSWDRVRQYLTS